MNSAANDSNNVANEAVEASCASYLKRRPSDAILIAWRLLSRMHSTNDKAPIKMQRQANVMMNQCEPLLRPINTSRRGELSS